MVFSTDPVPSKSKTKSMLFCGKAGRVQYPDPVKLDGKDLPWVECADHLGHTLHQETNMDRDSKRARAAGSLTEQWRSERNCSLPSLSKL